MTRPRLRTLWRAFVPSTPRTHDLRYDRDVGESGLSPVSSARSQSARIGNCDVHRGRTSPPDHCVQTSVTWRRTQFSITKYVPVPEHSPTPDTSLPTEGARPSNTPSNRPNAPRTHHQARGLHPQDQSSAPRVRPRVTPAPRRTPGQEPAGPHRGLRCPPGTYFSPRSLRSNLSDLEENAVLDHQVRPRSRGCVLAH